MVKRYSDHQPLFTLAFSLSIVVLIVGGVMLTVVVVLLIDATVV